MDMIDNIYLPQQAIFMIISIISGSQRINSQSLKVAKYLQSRLFKLDSEVQIHLFDLGQEPFPFAESEQTKSQTWIDQWTDIKPKFENSDAFIIISPEWNGSITPAILNFFLLAGKTLAHKPALLTTVSSGRGGAFPISMLRASGYKNTRTLYLPDHIIVRDVKNVLNEVDLETGTHDDQYLKARIENTLQILLEYAIALKPIRSSQTVDFETYPNGMQ